MSTYLVTGGAGFIGSHLSSALVARGHRVRVVDSLITGFERNLQPGVEFTSGDLAEPDVANAAVLGPELHEDVLAAMVDVPDPLVSEAVDTATAAGLLVDTGSADESGSLDGLEAALGASGLLDAWIHSDGSVEIDTERFDIVLGDRPVDGASLADDK